MLTIGNTALRMSPRVNIMSGNFTIEIGKRLRQLLEKTGKSNKELAFAMGVKENTVSYWIRGLKCPKQEMIKQLADYFHVSAEWLMYGRELPAVKDVREFEILQDLREAEELRVNTDDIQALLKVKLDLARKNLPKAAHRPQRGVKGG